LKTRLSKLSAMGLRFIEDPTNSTTDPNGGGTTKSKDDEKTDPPAKDDEDLGPGGLKALHAEREKVKELTSQLRALQAQADPAAANASAIEELRTEVAAAKQDALREKLARQHSLTDEHAALLDGDEARMTALAKAFAGTPKGTQGRAPDPHAGGAGGTTTTEDTLASGAELYKNRKKKA
jgi:outer membrane murein-binding lipoprotein Lpp